MMHTSPAERNQSRTVTPVGVVLILSRLQLMSQTVGAALRGRGVGAEAMSWAAGVHRATHDLIDIDMVLLLDDLEDRDSVVATQALVAQSQARFLILTNHPEGPAWGALLASGAVAVMPTESSLEEVDAVVALVRRGDSPMSETRRAQLVHEWDRWVAEGDRLLTRMARLSPRELAVLELLARGHSIGDIAAELGIAEATVSTQIKSMRRKLEVGSQLAAVAVVHRLDGTIDGSRTIVPSRREPEE